MTELLLKGLMGFSLLLFVGSVLALTATLLPRLLARLESEWSEGAFDLEQAPPRFPEMTTPPAPVRAAPAQVVAPPPEEPALAAAIGLALTLYLDDLAKTPERSGPTSAGNPWALAGRWQAMQARHQGRKR